MLGALITAGANVASNLGAAGLGYLSNRESNAANSREAEINRQWQEDMYNKYSSPAAMMRQYREAGLNPMLAQGVGAPGSTMSATPPSVAAHTPYNFSPLSDIPNALAQASQSGLAHAQEVNTYVDSLVRAYSELPKDKADAVFSTLSPVLSRLGIGATQTKKLQQSLTNESNARGALMDIQSNINQMYGYRRAEQEIENLRRVGENLGEQFKEIVSRYNLNDANTSLARSQVKRVSAEIMELGTRAAEELSRKGYFDALKGKTASEGQLLDRTMDYLVTQSELSTNMMSYDEQIQRAGFESKGELLKYITSLDGQKRIEFAYKMTAEGNYAIAAMCGVGSVTQSILPALQYSRGASKGAIFNNINTNASPTYYSPYSTTPPQY